MIIHIFGHAAIESLAVMSCWPKSGWVEHLAFDAVQACKLLSFIQMLKLHLLSHLFSRWEFLLQSLAKDKIRWLARYTL